MSCHVCRAPALPLGGACVFCHSPLLGGPETYGLLDYLAPRLPGAQVKRGGLLGRGSVRDLRFWGFRARRRGQALELTPVMPPPEWSDRLLREMSERAAADADLRRAMTRAGWALR